MSLLDSNTWPYLPSLPVLQELKIEHHNSEPLPMLSLLQELKCDDSGVTPEMKKLYNSRFSYGIRDIPDNEYNARFNYELKDISGQTAEENTSLE